MLNQQILKNKFTALSFSIVFILNLYYLYLVDHSYDTIAGIAAQDFALIIAMVWGAYYWIKLIKKPNPTFRYRGWMLSFSVLAILSSIQSNLLYGQSLIQGFAPQRWVLIWSLLYFPIRKMLYYKILKLKSLLKTMILVGFIQLVLFILQFYLKDIIVFLYVNEGFRNGRLRYYFSPILLDFMFLFLLDRVNKSKNIKKIPYMCCSGVIIFETMIVQQFRLTTMGLILCLGLYIIFVRTNAETKLVYFIIGAITLGFLFSTSMVQNVLEQVLHTSWDSGMLIRSVGRRHYFETLMKHPILGGGYPSNFYQPARYAAGIDQLIYLYDNGIFGFMYIYGIIGLIWLVSLWAKILKDGSYIQKQYSEMLFLLYPFFFIITCMNELHWYWEYGMVVFSLYLCAMEAKISEGGKLSEGYPY